MRVCLLQLSLEAVNARLVEKTRELNVAQIENEKLKVWLLLLCVYSFCPVYVCASLVYCIYLICMAVFRYQCTCVVLMKVSYLGNGSFTVVSHRVYLHTAVDQCCFKDWCGGASMTLCEML